MPKTKEEEEKEKALPIIVFIGLSGLAAAWLLLRGKPIEPDKAILYGLVTDAETYVGIADIDVDCDGHTAKTDVNGEYAIINIPPGTYAVTFTDPSGQYEGGAV